jgi:DNA replication protein DnaC
VGGVGLDGRCRCGGPAAGPISPVVPHPRGAELLFQVLTEREERASVAVASNAPFSEWGTTFTDPRLAAAVVDRLTFNAHILETGTDSYRLRSTRTNKGTTTTT